MLLLPAPLWGLCLMPSARVGTERADAHVLSSVIYLASDVARSCPHQVEASATTVHLRISGSHLGSPYTCDRQMACVSDSQQWCTVLGISSVQQIHPREHVAPTTMGTHCKYESSLACEFIYSRN